MNYTFNPGAIEVLVNKIDEPVMTLLQCQEYMGSLTMQNMVLRMLSVLLVLAVFFYVYWDYSKQRSTTP